MLGLGGWDVLAAVDIILPDEPEVYAWSLPVARAMAAGDGGLLVVGEGGLASWVPAFCD